MCLISTDRGFEILLPPPQVHQGVGFQSLLAEGVQGRVEFEVRGPRLNSSKVEKGSVVYSKDHRLHWKVTAPMPKIVVSGIVQEGVPNFGAQQIAGNLPQWKNISKGIAQTKSYPILSFQA